MSDAIAAIKDWVIRGKKNEAVAATREALEAGVDPGAIMKDGLIAAMSVVGERYSSGEFFLPQMMIAARAMTDTSTSPSLERSETFQRPPSPPRSSRASATREVRSP